MEWEIISNVIELDNMKYNSNDVLNCYFAWNSIYGFTLLYTKQVLTTGSHYEIRDCKFKYCMILRTRMGLKSKIYIKSGAFKQIPGVSVIDKFPEISNNPNLGNDKLNNNYPLYPFVSTLESIIKYNAENPDHMIKTRDFKPINTMLHSATRALYRGAPYTRFTIICKVKEHNFYSIPKSGKKIYAFKNEGEFIRYNFVHWLEDKAGKTHPCQKIKPGDIIIADGIQVDTSVKSKPYFHIPQKNISSDPQIYHNFGDKWTKFFKDGKYHNNQKRIKNIELLWCSSEEDAWTDECHYRYITPQTFTSLKKAINHVTTTHRPVELNINCSQIVDANVLYATYQMKCPTCTEVVDDFFHCNADYKNPNSWFQGLLHLTIKDDKNEQFEIVCFITGKALKVMKKYAFNASVDEELTNAFLNYDTLLAKKVTDKREYKTAMDKYLEVIQSILQHSVDNLQSDKTQRAIIKVLPNKASIDELDTHTYILMGIENNQKEETKKEIDEGFRDADFVEYEDMEEAPLLGEMIQSEMEIKLVENHNYRKNDSDYQAEEKKCN